MKEDEKNAIFAIVIISLFITSGMVVYTLVQPPSEQRYFSISSLDEDEKAVGLISVGNNSMFNFYYLIENHLGYTGYLKIEVLKGIILNESNPEFSNCSLFLTKYLLLEAEASVKIKIVDSINFTSVDQKYIYYCLLYDYNLTSHQFDYNNQWVAMQVNMTS
ncbi:MAG: hypothetical protein ACTSYR_04690 [Candidatus Odinarchaeia archaeon]